MRYEALENFTGSLPRVEDREFDELAGLSTEESILAGCRVGLLSEAHYRIHRYEKMLGNLNVILCGGDASFLANHLKTGIFAQPLLVHYGIYHCLKIND
jgi:type III pantothenate kinase